MQSLSVVVITFNEEMNIRGCIESVQNIASEIIVLDSGSADKTCEIAAAMGATVHSHPFEGHIQQKNRAKDLATKDWILSLDADERLSPQLSEAIAGSLQSPKFQGYNMNRLNHFCGRPIKTCGWYPDTKLRLWKKGNGAWTGQNPHDRFELFEGTVGHLQGDLLHFTYQNREAMQLQVEKFARISAEAFRQRSLPYLILKMLFSGTFKFIKTWIFQRGFLSGSDGLFICSQQAREVYLKYFLAIKYKSQSTGTGG